MEREKVETRKQLIDNRYIWVLEEQILRMKHGRQNRLKLFLKKIFFTSCFLAVCSCKQKSCCTTAYWASSSRTPRWQTQVRTERVSQHQNSWNEPGYLPKTLLCIVVLNCGPRFWLSHLLCVPLIQTQSGFLCSLSDPPDVLLLMAVCHLGLGG